MTVTGIKCTVFVRAGTVDAWSELHSELAQKAGQLHFEKCAGIHSGDMDYTYGG